MSPGLTLSVLIGSALIGGWFYWRVRATTQSAKASAITFGIAIGMCGLLFAALRAEWIVLSGFVGIWVFLMLAWSALSLTVLRVVPAGLRDTKVAQISCWGVAALFWPLLAFTHLISK